MSDVPVEARELLARIEQAAALGSAVPESTAAAEPRLCPVCGHNPEHPEVQTTEEDRREFMRCVLGERLFDKVYLIGEKSGKPLRLKLQVLTGEQSELMDRMLRAIDGEDVQSRIMGLRKIKIMFYVREVGDDKYDPPRDNQDPLQLYQERFGGKSELLPALLIRSVVLFEQLVGILVKSVFDENFWRGAGLV
jgi:hypothetical protein